MVQFIGNYTEQQLRDGVDKIEVNKQIELTNLKYVISKIITKKGVKLMSIHITDQYELT